MITLSATHQQIKRVVDPVMSTYQTVLTISQSVGQSVFAGLYSCIVENARGISSRAVVIPGNGELLPYVHILLGQLIMIYQFVGPRLLNCQTQSPF